MRLAVQYQGRSRRWCRVPSTVPVLGVDDLAPDSVQRVAEADAVHLAVNLHGRLLPLERGDERPLEAAHRGDEPVNRLEGIGERLDGGIGALFDDLGVLLQLSQLLFRQTNATSSTSTCPFENVPQRLIRPRRPTARPTATTATAAPPARPLPKWWKSICHLLHIPKAFVVLKNIITKHPVGPLATVPTTHAVHVPAINVPTTPTIVSCAPTSRIFATTPRSSRAGPPVPCRAAVVVVRPTRWAPDSTPTAASAAVSTMHLLGALGWCSPSGTTSARRWRMFRQCTR